MRAPQTARHDVAFFLEMPTVRLHARTQHLGVLRTFALHLRDQRIRGRFIERGDIGVASGGAPHRNPRSDARMQAKRRRRARVFEIDQFEAIRDDEADGAGNAIRDIAELVPDEIAHLPAAHHRGAHRHRARPDAIFLVVREIDQLPHAGQRVRQAGDGGSRQAAAVGYLQIAEPGFMSLEAAQHIERARYDLNDIIAAGKIGEVSSSGQPL